MPAYAPAIRAALAKAPHLTNWVLCPWLDKAIAELGTAEKPGKGSNSRILDYRTMAHLAIGGDDSDVPWCAIFVNAMLAQAGVKTSGTALARSFTHSPDFVMLDEPVVGCISVISSSRGPSSGHVFFYTGENGLFFQALGGNQDDSVCIAFFQKKKLVGHYWPKSQPLPPAPYNKPFKLPRPLLPHERAAKDA